MVAELLFNFLQVFLFSFFFVPAVQQHKVLIKHGDFLIASDTSTDQGIFCVSVLSFKPAITNKPSFK